MDNIGKVPNVGAEDTIVKNTELKLMLTLMDDGSIGWQLYKYENEHNQKWLRGATIDGHFTLKNVSSGKFLKAPDVAHTFQIGTYQQISLELCKRILPKCVLLI